MEDYLDRLGGSLIDSRGRQRGCARSYVALQTQLRACLAQLGVGIAVKDRAIVAVRHWPAWAPYFEELVQS